MPRLSEEIAFDPAVEAGPRPRPFLKSAGGKRQLLDELRKHVPKTFGTYFEPFVGGGALFFDLLPQRATLGDANPWLVAAYKAVRDDVDGVIRFLKFHEARHSPAHFSEVRREIVDTPKGGLAQVAARVIYVNRVCFNGLWRVNKAGRFNVPLGRYKNPTICDAPNLRACARALQGVSLVCNDFEKAVHPAKTGDFVYFDPPYASSFAGYTKKGFAGLDQARLCTVARMLRARGVTVLLSNSDVPFIRRLYGPKGFEMRRVEARRAINSKPTKRGPVGELIIY